LFLDPFIIDIDGAAEARGAHAQLAAAMRAAFDLNWRKLAAGALAVTPDVSQRPGAYRGRAFIN
jgi:hypothetical protein